MYGLSKKEKLHNVMQMLTKSNISAYEISQNTSLTENGVKKIRSGESKNPQEKSLNELLLFFEKLQLENKLNVELFTVSESNEKYNKTEGEEFRDCLKEVNKLTLEVVRLQNILRENNIEFKNIFEE